MAYYRRRGYRSAGHEAAIQHIREAQELSHELGGTDKDVKKYFFSLDARKRQSIFDEYEQTYGAAARRYAEETYKKWARGNVQMGGQTAARLFRLLPRRMPLEKKYDLVETLWEKYSPRSEYSLIFGRGSSRDEIQKMLADHLAQVVEDYEVPEPLQNRFEWLSDGDSVCCQQLLNHFVMRDKQLAVDVVGQQLMAILQALQFANSPVEGFRRELRIGGHLVTLVLDHQNDEIRLIAGTYRPRPVESVASKVAGFLFPIAVVVGLIFLLGRGCH